MAKAYKRFTPKLVAKQRSKLVNTITLANFFDDFSTAFGSKYEALTATANLMPVISSSRITCPTGSVSVDVTMRVAPSYLTFNPAQSVEWVYVSSTSTNMLQGGILRSSGIDATQNSYVCSFKVLGAEAKIWKVVGGVFANSNTQVAVAPFTPTLGATMKCEITSNNTINMYQNNVLILSYQDIVNPILSGQPGIIMRKSTTFNMVLDDFRARSLA